MGYFFAASGGGGSNGLLTNLTAYWQLNEASGNATDAHSGAKTLTQSGTVGAGTGVVSGSRTADGTNTNYFTRASEASFLPGAGAFSLSLWAKTASLTQTAFPGLIGPWDVGGNQRAWTVVYDDSTDGLAFAVSSNGTNETYTTTQTITNATWTHFVFVWDLTDIKVSKNGAAFVSTAFAGPVHNSTAALEMFRVVGGSASFNGELDQVGFWKGRALSLSDAQALYNAGAGLAYASLTA